MPGAPWGVHLLEGAGADSPEIFCDQKFSGLSAVPGAGGGPEGSMSIAQKDREDEVRQARTTACTVAGQFRGVAPEELLGAAWEATHSRSEDAGKSAYWIAFEAACALASPDGRHRARRITIVHADPAVPPPEPCDEADLEDLCLGEVSVNAWRTRLQHAKRGDRLVAVFDRLVADADTNEIAAELGVSRRSVERSVCEIRELLAPARAEILGSA